VKLSNLAYFLVSGSCFGEFCLYPLPLFQLIFLLDFFFLIIFLHIICKYFSNLLFITMEKFDFECLLIHKSFPLWLLGSMSDLHRLPPVRYYTSLGFFCLFVSHHWGLNSGLHIC
jgi:hypothetical protein